MPWCLPRSPQASHPLSGGALVVHGDSSLKQCIGPKQFVHLSSGWEAVEVAHDLHIRTCSTCKIMSQMLLDAE